MSMVKSRLFVVALFVASLLTPTIAMATDVVEDHYKKNVSHKYMKI